MIAERANRCPLHPEASLQPVAKSEDLFWGAGEGSFSYGSCELCGSWLLNPRPQELGLWYSGYYSEKELKARRQLLAEKPLQQALAADWIRAKDSQRQLKRLGVDLAEMEQILDAGCGLGGFLRGLRELTKAELRGLDFDPRCEAFARVEHDLRVDSGELRDQKYPSGSFDLITSWHCLEHVEDPQAELEELARITRPGGWLLIELPTPGLLARLFRGRWLFLQAPPHLFLPRPEALKALVEKAGFIVRSQRRPWLPSEIAGGLLLSLGFRPFAPRLLFPPRALKDRGWHLLFMLLILFLDLPISALLALFGSSGIVQIIAEKSSLE